MMYEYKCPNCGWEGTKLCKIAERDEQLCEQPAKDRTWIEEAMADEDARCVMYLDRAAKGRDLTEEEVQAIKDLFNQCRTKLVREEISQTAALPNQWSRWTGKTV